MWLRIASFESGVFRSWIESELDVIVVSLSLKQIQFYLLTISCFSFLQTTDQLLIYEDEDDFVLCTTTVLFHQFGSSIKAVLSLEYRLWFSYRNLPFENWHCNCFWRTSYRTSAMIVWALLSKHASSAFRNVEQHAAQVNVDTESQMYFILQ